LAITWDHAARLASLPMLHRDPFDRILIAQAMAEDLTLITSDAAIAQYPHVEILRA
jgi:PIN domain nuclease of toxin-antitoxin system